MEDRIVTLAIHTSGKSQILKQVLEEHGIAVFLDNTDPEAIRVRIRENNIAKALFIIEEHGLFSYRDQQTYQLDDGRKRILVAVDFSSYSLNACRTAFNIARNLNAKVKILHVYNNARYSSTFPFADISIDEKDTRVLNKTRKQMLHLCCKIDEMISKGELPSINYSYSLREGLVVEDEIEDFILEYKPILLVLGTKGKDNNECHLLGNITADIIEITNIPVLAVPEGKLTGDISDSIHLAFLTNFPERDQQSFLTLYSSLGLKKNAKITLLHVNPMNKKGNKWSEADLQHMKEYILDQCQDLNIEYKLINSPDILKAVTTFIQDEQINVVAVNTQRRNVFTRILNPSVSRKLLSNSETALLVLRGS